MRQNPATANTLATKMYEERLKLPLQRDPLDDAAMKVLSIIFYLKTSSFTFLYSLICLEKFIQQRFGDNMGQLLEPNHASLLKSAAVSGQPGYAL